MKTADLITSYFNNELSPEQERQFLLSVAASDSLRLALKSHFMLDRIVSDQAERVHVPEALRTTIFAHASAALAGVEAPHEPVQASHPAPARSARPRIGRFFGRGATIALFLFAGFGAGYLVHSEFAEAPAAMASPAVAAPSLAKPAPEMPSESPAVTGTRAAVEPSVTQRVATTSTSRSTPDEGLRGHHPISGSPVTRPTTDAVEHHAAADHATPTDATVKPDAGTHSATDPDIEVVMKQHKSGDSQKTPTSEGVIPKQ